MLKKILFFLTFTIPLLSQNEKCIVFFVKNFFKNTSYIKEGTKIKVLTKQIKCDNPIIKKIKKGEIYIKKKGTFSTYIDTNLKKNKRKNIEKTIFFEIYFKYIEKNKFEKEKLTQKNNNSNKNNLNKDDLIKKIKIIQKNNKIFEKIKNAINKIN